MAGGSDSERLRLYKWFALACSACIKFVVEARIDMAPRKVYVVGVGSKYKQIKNEVIQADSKWVHAVTAFQKPRGGSLSLTLELLTVTGRTDQSYRLGGLP